jgi:4-amino-4-deoxy-L-arabinose transferase-like glycosyltransferase
VLTRSQESTDPARPEVRTVTPDTRRRSPLALAIAIAIGAAILIRAATLVAARSASIDMDGAEYVRVAENLASGNGPLGMRGLPMMTFPLLYSGAIALGARLGGDAELVALAIASLSGIALAILMYRLALAVYGRETAVYAAAIAAVLPICVETSTSAITEAPFAALGALGLLNMVWLVRDGRGRHAAIAGASFGAASLLRPEGLLFALGAFAVIAVVTLAARRSALPLAAFTAAAAAFVVVSLATTYAATGRVALEGKTAINFSLADGLRTGAPYLSVADAVDPDGRPVGPEIDLRYYTPGSAPPQLPASRRAALAMRAAVNHVGESLRLFSDPAYGGGLLIALAVLGIAGAAWSRAAARDQLVMLAYLGSGFVALAGVWQFWPRYGMIFIPVVILWAAHGVAHLRRWSTRSRLPDVGLGALAALLIVSVGLDIAALRAVDRPLERGAAAWIAAHGPPTPLIADVSTRTAFYAHGIWRPLPYGDARAAARYLRDINPAYVVLDSRRADQYPPIGAWFRKGMPPALATAVYEARDPAGRTLSVYRLVRSVSDQRSR